MKQTRCRPLVLRLGVALAVALLWPALARADEPATSGTTVSLPAPAIASPRSRLAPTRYERASFPLVIGGIVVTAGGAVLTAVGMLKATSRSDVCDPDGDGGCALQDSQKTGLAIMPVRIAIALVGTAMIILGARKVPAKQP